MILSSSAAVRPAHRQSAAGPAATVLPASRTCFVKPSTVALRQGLKSSVQIRRQLLVRAAGTDVAPVGAVTDENWDKLVLESTVPVLVDFWAPWCGPCRMIAPLVDELAVQYGEKVRVLKLNTDESPRTATAYGIRSIPTVMLFKAGEKKESVIGAVQKSTLEQMVTKYIDG